MMQPEFPDLCDNAVSFSFMGKFWTVNANHTQAALFQFGFKFVQSREGSITVPAIKGPEIDEHHIAAQVVQAHRLCVNPVVGLLMGKVRRRFIYEIVGNRRAVQHRCDQYQEAKTKGDWRKYVPG